MNSPILSDEQFQAPLELSAIAMTFAVQSAMPRSPNAHDFVAAINAAASRAPSAEFPTTVERTVRRCGNPFHEIQRYAEQFVCHGGSGRYEEITAAAFGWWTSIDTRAPNIQAYLTRLDAFTIGTLREVLSKAGYEDFGIVAPQSSVHGFQTPLVHSAFRRNDARPVVIAGHRPEQVQNGATDGQQPAVMELRIYFSDEGMR